MKAKHLFVMLMLSAFCLSLLTVSCMQGRTKKNPKEAEVTLVTTIGCSGCQKTVESILAEADGVIEYQVDLPKKEVWVLYETDVTDVATLCEAIGYSAKEKLPQAEVTFNVNISCAGCQKTIENNLPNVAGVKELKVNLEEKEVWILYETGTTDKAKLAEAIVGLGYSATEI